MLYWEIEKGRIELLDSAAAKARINIANVMGGMIVHNQARVQPAKLVRGLAAAVERLGVPIYEKTAVSSICSSYQAAGARAASCPPATNCTRSCTPVPRRAR